MPRPPSRFTETCWKPSPRSRCEPGMGGGFFLEVDPASASRPPFLIPSAVSFPQEKTTSLPCDVAQDLRGLEAQLRRHEGLERELMGTEQQVSPGLGPLPLGAPQACPSALQLSPTLGAASQAHWAPRAGPSASRTRPFPLIPTLPPAAGAARDGKRGAEAGAQAAGPCGTAEAAGPGAGLGDPEAASRAAPGPAGAGMAPGPLPRGGEGSSFPRALCVCMCV